MQRRLEDWRSDVVHKIAFGDGELVIDIMPIDEEVTSPARTVS